MADFVELEMMAKAFEEAKLQDARMKKEIYKDHIEYLFASDKANKQKL